MPTKEFGVALVMPKLVKGFYFLFFLFLFIYDNAWMISGLKLSSTLPKVATKS